MCVVTKNSVGERKGDSWVYVYLRSPLLLVIIPCECFCPHSVSSSSLHLDGAWSLSEQQQRSLSTKCHITYNLYEGIRF